MQDAVSTTTRASKARANEDGDSSSATHAWLRASALTDVVAAIASSVLLILSFPNSGYWPLAWLALVPLLVVIALRPSPRRSFFLGWLTGAVFFYGSCYWLTYSMIHYGGIPSVGSLSSAGSGADLRRAVSRSLCTRARARDSGVGNQGPVPCPLCLVSS